MMIVVAIAVMVGCTIAVHLGLTQAVCRVVGKVCQCHRCLSFWAVLIVLAIAGTNIIIAAVLSIVLSYLSNWFAMLLVWLNEMYDRVWQKLNQKKMW